jgi:poly[(R)-3-hydroxyalkanoate] polymerase subunit PhaC
MAQQVAQEPVEAARGFGFDIRDPQRFAQNMARLVEETGKAVTAFVEPRVSNPAQALAGGGDFTHIMNALTQIQRAWLFQPQKLMEAQAELWQRYWQLWTSGLAILTGGGIAEPVAAPDPKDARFKDPAWSENQYFDFMKQAYLINSRWAERLVEQTENVDPDTRHKAGFYMKQVIAQAT